MGDGCVRLTELAKLKNGKADRAWNDIKETYADDIKTVFRDSRGVTAVDPEKGLEETIRWARKKLHQTVKKFKKIPPLTSFLLRMARFVHEIELVEAIKQKGLKGELAWAEIEFRYADVVYKYLEKHSRGSSADAEKHLEKALQKAKRKLQNGKYNPEKAGLEAFLIGYIAKFIPRENNPAVQAVKRIDDVIDANKIDLGNDRIDLVEPPRIPDSVRRIAFREIFLLLVENGGKPHQILAFCFIKLLPHWQSQNIKFVRELIDEAFCELGDAFCREYRDRALLYMKEAEYDKAWACLNEQFEKTFEQTYTEAEYRDETYLNLRGRPIGVACMRPFLEGKKKSTPEQGLSYFCDRVYRNLRSLYRC
jgi:hypothetical protein